MPTEVYLVGYADDVAAVIAGRNIAELQRKLNQVMLRTKEWLDSHGLKLATEKTELVLITKKHIPLHVEMQMLTDKMVTKSSIKYLGLRLDSRLNFTAQIQNSAEKAAKVTTYLSRLMANIGGPTESKRRLLMSTTQSILLYGADGKILRAGGKTKGICKGATQRRTKNIISLLHSIITSNSCYKFIYSN